MSSTSETTHTPHSQSDVYEKLRRLPSSAIADFDRFKNEGDEQALTRLIIAVLVDHAPEKAKGVSSWSDETRLMEDLRFDSLSTVETVFFFEDLFKIKISNEEIMKVGTVGQLRAFVKAKVGASSNP